MRKSTESIYETINSQTIVKIPIPCEEMELNFLWKNVFKNSIVKHTISIIENPTYKIQLPDGTFKLCAPITMVSLNLNNKNEDFWIAKLYNVFLDGEYEYLKTDDEFIYLTKKSE
jgi:hypothetical protein